MREEDANYYRRRAAVETEAARTALCPAAVAAHQRLAAMYSAQVDGAAAPRSMTRG